MKKIDFKKFKLPSKLELPKLSKKENNNSNNQKLELPKFSFNFRKVSIKSLFQKYSYNTNEIATFAKHEEEFILFKNGNLNTLEYTKHINNAIVTDFLTLDDFTLYKFEMTSKELEDIDDLDDFIDIKIYEEAEIDSARDYIIKYSIKQSFIDEKKHFVECIIIEKQHLLTKYEQRLQNANIRYLDFLSFPGFVFNSIYKNNLLIPKNDIFIFFKKEGILISTYIDGEYLDTTIISNSIDNLFKKLTNLKIKNFSYELMEKILVHKGLKQNKYKEHELLIFNEISESFSTSFQLIGNIIFEITRKYAIEAMDRIIIGSYLGEIPGIKDYVTLYLGLEVKELNFSKKYNPSININELAFTNILYTKDNFDRNFIYNFSQFHRPPTFFFRPSGQLITSFIASMLLFSIYPTYLYINNYFTQNENKILDTDIKHISRNISNLKNKEQKVQKELKKIEEDISYLEEKLTKSKQLINIILDFKLKYIPVSKTLTNITYFLNKNNVYADSIEYENKTYILNIKAKDEKYITNFLFDLVNNGFTSYTKEINFDGKYYISTIEVSK